ASGGCTWRVRRSTSKRTARRSIRYSASSRTTTDPTCRCGRPGRRTHNVPLVATEFSFLDWPVPIPFAHRGGASEAPENTMPAFEYAVGLGYRYVETDVHVTADGVLLAFHDDVLDRVTNRTSVIAELPWATVREAKVDG